MVVNTCEADASGEVTHLCCAAQLVGFGLNRLERRQTLIGIQHSSGRVHRHALRLEEVPSWCVGESGAAAAVSDRYTGLFGAAASS